MQKNPKNRQRATPEPAKAVEIPQWSEWTRHLVVILLLVATVVAVLVLRPIFGVLALALLTAFLMYRPARLLTRHMRMNYHVAVILSYVVLLTILGFIMAISTPLLIDQTAALWASVEAGFNNVQSALVSYEPQQGVTEVFGVQVDFNFMIEPVREFFVADQGDSAFAETFGIDPRTLLDNALQVGTTVTQALAMAFTSISGFLSTVLIGVFVSFLILLDLPRNEKTVTDWLPPAYYREYALLIDRLHSVWSGFFRGQVFIGIFIGLLTWLQLELMGISNAVLLAFITGIISLIPTIGGFIALVPLSIVPLFSGSTLYPDASGVSIALSVVLVNLIISQIIWNVVAPKIMGDVLDLPLPVVILGVFAGASVGGILGAFLASPVIASLQVLTNYLLRKLSQQDPFPGETAPFTVGKGWLSELSQVTAIAPRARWRRPQGRKTS